MTARTRLFLLAGALALASFGVEAAEPTPQELPPICRNFTIDAAPQIDACTRLIAFYGQNVETAGIRAMAYLARGAAYRRNGDAERAAADYREAIRLDTLLIDSNTMEPLFYNERCWARAIAMIDLDGALSDCNEALRLRPVFNAARDSRAFVHLRRGAYRDAITDYDAVLSTSPRDFYSLFGRGIAKLRLGAAGGNADIAAAVAAQRGIAEEFAAYGLRP